MKALRTVLLGSAGAALLFVTGMAAQAADAPDAVKGREPVWRCDTAGFIEYPGSDVCFKIGLTVTAWLGAAPDNVETDGGAGAFDVWPDFVHTDTDTFWMGAWARPNIDIRKATEFGIVRLYAEFQIGEGHGNMRGRHTFIQIGNWLIGNTSTTFHHGVGRPEQFDEGLGSIGDPNVTRVVQVRYTFDLGNGVQVNVAIQDPARYGKDYIDGHYDLFDSRNESPDFAANVKVSTTWGKIGASVTARQESFALDHTDGITERYRREWVWAALLGVQVNVGPNDTLKAMGGYADGFLSVLENGALGSIGLVPPIGNAQTQNVTGWSVVGGWTHNWSSTLRSTFAAAYIENDYNRIPGVLFGGGFGDNDCCAILNATNVWGNLVWTVVDGFDLGVEVMWMRNERQYFFHTHDGSAVAGGITASASY